MIVICGLGNPGTKYKNTRHNIGFEFIDKILNDYKLQLSKKDKLKEVYKVKIKNINYFLIKPLTYVNLSGPTIANFLNFYKIPKKNLRKLKYQEKAKLKQKLIQKLILFQNKQWKKLKKMEIQ